MTDRPRAYAIVNPAAGHGRGARLARTIAAEFEAAGMTLEVAVSPGPGEAARLAFFGLTLTGVVFAGYLTYLELFVIGAICPWCVSVAACVVALFALAVRDLAQG